MSILSQQKQSVSADFPNVRPSLDLRFALAKKLDPRITFTRASTGTYFGPDGFMRTAGVNDPRFDHDPVTGQSLGLLIEESRQNLLTYSNDFTNAVWTPFPNTIPSANQTGLDGTTSAFTYTTLSTTSNYVYQNFTCTASTTYTFSFYVKLGTLPASSYKIAVYNNTASSFIAVDVVPTQTLSSSSWTRVSYSFTTPAGCTSARVYPYRNTNPSQNNGTIFLWGAQLEAGAFPTSYIPTTASTVTRSADVATMTGTNFSSWYNSSEGSIVSNCITRRPPNTGNGADFAITNSFTTTYTSRIVGWFNIGPAPFFSVFANNNTVYLPFIGVPSVVTNIPVKKAISLADKNMRVSTNGKLITSDLGNTGVQDYLPTDFNRLLIGYEGIFAGYLNGTISRLTYYPIQLTNQQLINLTS
jgi:hypothetical protein